jgi:hypothetical protein
MTTKSEVLVPADMSIRERAAYLDEIKALERTAVPSSAAGVLARYIGRSTDQWNLVSDRDPSQATVPVNVELLEAVSEALMGLDSRLIRGIQSAIAIGARRVLGEREACAKDWEHAHGFDKHGVAAWLRSGGLE